MFLLFYHIKVQKVTFWTLKACLKSVPPDLLIPCIKVRLKKVVHTLIPGIKKGFSGMQWRTYHRTKGSVSPQIFEKKYSKSPIP